MTELILVRHGETAWNVEEIYRGRTDVGLDEVGLEQAKLIGKYLGNLQLEAIYSSPLKRAIDTANAVAQYQKVGVEVANGLMDFDYGEWQGLRAEEVQKLYQDLHSEWHANPDRVRMPGGESLSDVKDRAVEVVKKVVSEHEGSVALVSHRVVNKVLICSLLGLGNGSFWNIKQDVAGITTFNYAGGRIVLIRHNDTSHLRGMQRYVLEDF
jgi:phosphoserine phosphatase